MKIDKSKFLVLTSVLAAGTAAAALAVSCASISSRGSGASDNVRSELASRRQIRLPGQKGKRVKFQGRDGKVFE